MQFISEAFGVVFDFIDMGGPVLLLIGGLLFLMWSLIFERIFYFSNDLKADLDKVKSQWEKRTDRRSWHASRAAGAAGWPGTRRHRSRSGCRAVPAAVREALPGWRR